VVNLFAILLGTGALTRVSLESHHDLVNQIFVVCTTKNGLGRFEFRSGLALVIQEF
jgi:hypothetical protein